MSDDGIEQWLFEGQTVGSMGLNAVVTWPKEEWGFDPVGLRGDAPGRVRHPRARPRHEPQRRARVDVLPDLRRVQRAACSRRRRTRTSPLVIVQAYNDWHIDEWCAAYPDRFIPLAIPPVWDPQAWSPRVRRVAAKGCRAITMPELPHIQGLPSYHDLDYWDPFFRAVSEEQVS